MKRGAKRSKSTTSSIVELVVIVLVALGLALGIQAWVVKPYRIPSGSMERPLAIGQRVLVNRIGMHFGKPHVGEIAVVSSAEGRRAAAVRGDSPHDQGRRGGVRGTRARENGGHELHQADRRRTGRHDLGSSKGT